MKRAISVLFLGLIVLAFSETAGAQMMGMGQQPGAQMPTGQGMMPGGMSPCGMMMGMMPPRARGCMELSCLMMNPGADMAPLREALGLTPEQAEKLKDAHRPFQKEAVRIGASLKIAEMDVADLLGADNLDMKKIEVKFREIEKIRTELAMNHVNALAAVRKILTKDQIEKLGKVGPCGGAPCGPGAPCSPGTPCGKQAPVHETPPQTSPETAPEREQHH